MLSVTNPKNHDPSLPRAFYGAELRRLREAAGMSQDKLGEQLFCSGAYIGQIEAAAQKPQLEVAERLDRVLNTDGSLARMCRVVNRSRHPEYFAEAADLESGAETISEYGPMVVPGLLQTEAYARALTRAAHPFAPQEEVEGHVAARLDRARILDDPTGPELWVILHEAALQVQVGGCAAIREQLAHIVDSACSNRALVQVLPDSAGAHAFVNGMVSLMTFTDSPPVAYVEGAHIGQLVDDAEVVARYQRSFDLVRAAALSPEASLTLIEMAAEEHAR
ncbi:helix-turn-helix transcriptional regulator [Streptomyces sp. NPDC004647]|uniref:helix-turn-helix domain-containing protein n=1 Tax=Streptomyces sp. NPDC004647 TaxID=3154671 RepID=UPI0033AF2FBF